MQKNYVELQDERQYNIIQPKKQLSRSSSYQQDYRKNSQNIIENFERIFDQDHIRDGVALKVLQEIGGISILSKQLDVNLDHGIDTQKDQNTINLRQKIFGKNLPISLPPKTFISLILDQFEDATLRILLIATLVSLVIGLIQDPYTGWFEGVAILVAVSIIVLITATNDYMKEKQFQKLNAKLEEKKVQVLRNGKLDFINIFDLVVGDILVIQIGDILPVDGIAIISNKLKVDESQMTGETDFIEKDAAPKNQQQQQQQIQQIQHGNQSHRSNVTPFIISGSKIMEGDGQILVCTVGEHTCVGKLKANLLQEQPPTPLQLKLEGVANDIGKIGIACALLTVSVLTIYLVVDIVLGKVDNITKILDRLVGFIMIGITIIVMAVPEGLPLAVTIALAFSLEKMRKDNNLVKQLHSCETMGGANNICTDKTGTLTQNKMTATDCFIEENNIKCQKDILLQTINKQTLQLFCQGICVNTTAVPRYDSRGIFEHLGNPTECALLELCLKLGYNYSDLRQPKFVERTIPFSSARKKMTTVFFQQDKNCHYVFTKGASEIILENCTKYINKKGLQSLDQHYKTQLRQNIIDKYASQSLRVIGIAYKEVHGSLAGYKDDQLEQELVLIGFVGIQDPLKDGIIEAVKNCKSAGITIRMVTGDNIITACAISKQAGILEQDYDLQQPRQGQEFRVLEGKKFRQLVGGLVFEEDQLLQQAPQIRNQNTQQDMEANQIDQRKQIQKKKVVKNLDMFRKVASELRVLARSTPEDKLILVTGLIQTNNVVAVTGDGTNDAPALKKADVGFAMGIAGTEVAKEAAGIILLDDNFASIVNACKWGRNIFDCIRKFIQFQLTVNIVALCLAFIGAVAEKQSPITPIQMLWVNLIMDTFASLALATEPPSEDQLKQPPYKRDGKMISPNMWRNIIGQSIYQIVVLFIIMYFGPTLLGIPNSFKMKKFNDVQAVHLTIFFNTFVFLQIFNQINARKLKRNEINIFRGFFNNPMFFVIELFVVVVQIALVEFGGQFVNCTSLSLEHHGLCIMIGALGLIIGILIKILPEAFFTKIKFLEQEEVVNVEEYMQKMDHNITSSLRRKFSKRTTLVRQESKTLQSSQQHQQSIKK